jgi:hypothetical protein
MEIILPPEVKLGPRVITLIILLLPLLLVSGMPWWLRLAGCIVPLAITGTYRISKLNGDKFRTQLVFAFIAFKPVKCNLPGVIYIETRYNAAGGGLAAWMLFGPLGFLMSFVFDLLLPVLGGAYEIWLITAKGREILAWQGLNQHQFETSLALLTARTGAEVRGRSR